MRDGSHVVRHQFTTEQVASIASALDAAGVNMVEVSHGDGLGGSSLQYGLSRVNELDLIRTARSVLSRAKLTVLLLPGIGTRDDLKAAASSVLKSFASRRIAPRLTLPSSISGGRASSAWKWPDF